MYCSVPASLLEYVEVPVIRNLSLGKPLQFFNLFRRFLMPLSLLCLQVEPALVCFPSSPKEAPLEAFSYCL